MTVSVSTNARSYGLRYNQRAKDVQGEVRDVMRRVQRQALREARKASSGTFGSPATLKAMGHPYSRRAPRAVAADYPARINVNSGRFRAAWQTRTTVNKKSVSVKLSNPSPHAKYLTAAGTRKMVGRPALELIQSRTPGGGPSGAGSGQTKALRDGMRRAVGRPVSGGVGFTELRSAFMQGYRAGLSVARVIGV